MGRLKLEPQSICSHNVANFWHSIVGIAWQKRQCKGVSGNGVTIMNVRELPRNCIFTHGAMSVNSPAPAPARSVQGAQSNPAKWHGWVSGECQRLSARPLILEDIAWHWAEQRTKQQHPQEVSAAPAERALLQGFAVLHQKEHVEYKVQACTGKVAFTTCAAVGLQYPSSIVREQR